MLYYLSRTMLIERLCGVFVYALALVLTYLALKNARSYRKLNRILNTYLMILTLMGFFYIPSESADLHRWLWMTRNWHMFSFSEFVESQMVKSSYPIGLLIIYLCQKTRIAGILPAVCSFLFHWNSFSILKMVSKKFGYSPRSLALPLFLFMSGGFFLEAISGVRCFVALAILARQLCEELLDQKIRLRNLLWEIAASLIHPLALILWAIRIAFLLLQKSKTIQGKIANICISAAIIVVGMRYGGSYFVSATERAAGYISSEMYSYSWEYIMGWIIWTVMVYVLYYANKINKTVKSVPHKNLVLFSFILIIVELLCCFEYSIFHRTVVFSAIMLLPASAFLLSHSPARQHRTVILCASALVLFLACARGNLCGYKFFLLS